jgi:hypothetical protein
MPEDAPSGSTGKTEIRELESRLQSLLEQVDLARDEMSAGEVDSALLREAGALRRQIDELHRKQVQS